MSQQARCQRANGPTGAKITTCQNPCRNAGMHTYFHFAVAPEPLCEFARASGCKGARKQGREGEARHGFKELRSLEVKEFKESRSQGFKESRSFRKATQRRPGNTPRQKVALASGGMGAVGRRAGVAKLGQLRRRPNSMDSVLWSAGASPYLGKHLKMLSSSPRPRGGR